MARTARGWKSARVRELREKYLEMRAMRVAHANGEGGDPRRRMRALAARFPGALREIDELPLEVIEARIEELDAALAGRREAPRWAVLLERYHAWMRAVLAIRRAAGAERDHARALAWIEGAPEEEGGPRREELRAALDAILRPPEGRLNRWIFERLGRDAGLDPAQAEAALFPAGGHRGRTDRG